MLHCAYGAGAKRHERKDFGLGANRFFGRVEGGESVEGCESGFNAEAQGAGIAGFGLWVVARLWRLTPSRRRCSVDAGETF
jgi:hypothetical protein